VLKVVVGKRIPSSLETAAPGRRDLIE